jgi:hypothetical protein
MNTFGKVVARALPLLLSCVVASPAAADSVSLAQLAGGSLTYSQSGVTFQSSALPTGVFSALANTTISLADLTFAAPGPIGVFTAAPGLAITATAVPGAFSAISCFAAPANGQTCTPPIAGLSPLNLYNTANGSVASVSLALTIQDGGQTYSGTGILTMQFTESYQQVLATIAGGGQMTSSFSAQFDAGTAGTMSFGGGGSLGIGGIDLAAQGYVGALPGGLFRVDTTSTGLFAPLANTLGASAELAPTADFLTFLANPLIGFDLTAIDPGVFGAFDCFSPAAWEQGCTLPGSSFDFVNTAYGSILSFNVDGMLTGPGGFSTPSTGIYSTQFVGRTYQQVLADALAGGRITGLYSATFAATTPDTPVPEPLSVVLFGLGVIAAYRRRQR